MNESQISNRPRRLFIFLIALLIGFSVFAKGAHDIWAATLVYLSLLGLLAGLFLAKPPISLKIMRLQHLMVPLAMLGVFVISFWRSANPSESFLALMDWTACIMMYFIAINIFETDTDIKMLAALLIPVFLIESALMFGQWVRIAYLVKQGLLPYEEPTGTLLNGNSAVAFTLLWIPYLFTQSRISIKSRWYWSAGVVALGLIIFMVMSTWGTLCLLAGLLLYVDQFRIRAFYKSHRSFFLIGTGLLSLGICLLLWHKLAMIYGWDHLGPKRIAPTSRLDWWISGLKMWKDHPWFGVGIGNFPSAYLAYKTGMGQNTLYAHSFIVEMLAETGTVGCAAVLFFIASTLYTVRSAFRDEQKPLLIGIIMFVLFSLLQISFEYLSHLLAFGLLLGILNARVRPWRNGVPRLSLKILAVGLCFLAVPYVLSPFLANRLWVDGNMLISEKKWDLAEKRFRSACAIDDRPWEPYWGLAQIEKERGNYAEATRQTEQALKRNKFDQRLKKALSDVKSN